MPPSLSGMGFWEVMAIHAVWAVPPTIMALVALLNVVKSRKATKADIREIHLIINSRMTDFIDAAKQLSFAEGVKSTEDKIDG